MTVSSKIKSLLKMQNAEHSALAEHLGISKQAFSNKLYRGSFSAQDLIIIADFLKCDLSFIVGESKITLDINDIEGNANG